MEELRWKEEEKMPLETHMGGINMKMSRGAMNTSFYGSIGADWEGGLEKIGSDLGRAQGESDSAANSCKKNSLNVIDW